MMSVIYFSLQENNPTVCIIVDEERIKLKTFYDHNIILKERVVSSGKMVTVTSKNILEKGHIFTF
jgi:hypothetical protein